jgi:hypothetical protein
MNYIRRLKSKNRVYMKTALIFENKNGKAKAFMEILWRKSQTNYDT